MEPEEEAGADGRDILLKALRDFFRRDGAGLRRSRDGHLDDDLAPAPVLLAIRFEIAMQNMPITPPS